MELARRHRLIRRLWRDLDLVLPLGMARGRKGSHTLSSSEETDRVGEHHTDHVPVRQQLRRGQLRPHLLPGCKGRRSVAKRLLHAALHPDAVAVPGHLWRSW